MVVNVKSAYIAYNVYAWLILRRTFRASVLSFCMPCTLMFWNLDYVHGAMSSLFSTILLSLNARIQHWITSQDLMTDHHWSGSSVPLVEDFTMLVMDKLSPEVEEKKSRSRVQTVSDHLNVSQPLVLSWLQYVVEVVMALVLVGLLLVLCKSVGQKWLARFCSEILKAQRPI